ncbi:hypothetical protein PAPHI01_1462 [Pancytospora philotis]|nr:hypothetical protein PAPHI01_1462 [Pancytospora philotis]
MTADKALSKKSEKIVYEDIPMNIPEAAVKLDKLADGFKLSIIHTESSHKEGVKSEYCYKYAYMQRLGRPVRDVTGGFNSAGKYEVDIEYADKDK